ncbi:ORF6N domain-containing protein [Segetibacter sp. 3557_3]|uniref:ORF6N domain-containing protein n=1 Tax=Segetibacter sp. 3557_3 TaxID=2547429 RepID=UPI0010590D10|nr:ORF6N domain-containing protein [Segetibacter sp. 3557_3]TDH24231.1 ORF6N domain-containing protein [Segetibacter sp. 3557_3]
MNLVLIQQKIFDIREQRVMLDYDLAVLYDVETRVLNQAVKRNKTRFPADFMFRLTSEEWAWVRSQTLIDEEQLSNSSQNVMSRGRHRGATYLPYAFTEHGVTMLASVLRSEKAVKMNIAIVRAFIALRQLSQQYKELAEKLAELEKHTNKQFTDIYEALNFLVDKKKEEEAFATRERIGFKK